MHTRYRCAAERLEDRWLLAITSVFDETGRFSIDVDGPDDVILTEVLGQVATEEFTSIVISASGDFPNRFDLSSVDEDNFPALTRVIVRSGAGDDEILAPRVAGFLDGGSGDDTIVVDFQNLPGNIVLTTFGSVAVNSLLYAGIENFRATNASPDSLTLRVQTEGTLDTVTTIRADSENTVVETERTRLHSIRSNLIGQIEYEGSSADQLVLDVSQGDIIPARGSSITGGGSLTILGDRETTVVRYLPGKTTGEGDMLVNGRNVEFTALQQVNFLDANEVVVRELNRNFDMTIQNTTLLNPSTSENADAIEISGNTRVGKAVRIVPAVIRNSKTVVVHTPSPIEIASADNMHAIVNLTLLAGQTSVRGNLHFDGKFRAKPTAQGPLSFSAPKMTFGSVEIDFHGGGGPITFESRTHLSATSDILVYGASGYGISMADGARLTSAKGDIQVLGDIQIAHMAAAGNVFIDANHIHDAGDTHVDIVAQKVVLSSFALIDPIETAVRKISGGCDCRLFQIANAGDLIIGHISASRIQIAATPPGVHGIGNGSVTVEGGVKGHTVLSAAGSLTVKNGATIGRSDQPSQSLTLEFGHDIKIEPFATVHNVNSLLIRPHQVERPHVIRIEGGLREPLLETVILGGNANDTIVLNQAINFPGVIDGRGGSDTYEISFESPQPELANISLIDSGSDTDFDQIVFNISGIDANDTGSSIIVNETGRVQYENVEAVILAPTGLKGDFDGDGKVSAADIDLLFATADARFDLTGDQLVDSKDSDVLIRDVLNTASGDANLDGRVDFSDFLTLLANYDNENVGWAGGDFDGSGIVDFSDFLKLAHYFGFERPRGPSPKLIAADPRDPIVIGNTLFFTAEEVAHGRELWKSDGSRHGTTMVRDIRPGSFGSVFSAAGQTVEMAVVGDALFFVADDGVHGPELWKSDGTQEGTQLVRDILKGPLGSLPRELTDVNGTLFFVANNDVWKSDGTEQGTTRVSSENARELVAINEVLFYTDGKELKKTDAASSRGGTPVLEPTCCAYAGLTNVDGTLFFYEDIGSNSRLWKSDGTAAGTEMIRMIRLGRFRFESKFVHNGMLFFTNDAELWKTDLTANGTNLLKEERGCCSFTNVNDVLFLTTSSSLWTSDGTSSGTVVVKEDISDPRFLIDVGGTLFFTSAQGIAIPPRREIWKSDGTAAGTMMLDIFPGDEFVRPDVNGFLIHVNGRLFFAAPPTRNDVRGNELWVSDQTSAGTKRLTGT